MYHYDPDLANVIQLLLHAGVSLGVLGEGRFFFWDTMATTNLVKNNYKKRKSMSLGICIENIIPEDVFKCFKSKEIKKIQKLVKTFDKFYSGAKGFKKWLW
jgi:hypothetical protein